MSFSIIKKGFPVIALGALAVQMAACSSKKTDATDERAAYVIPDSVMKTLKIDTVTTSTLAKSIKFNGIVDFDPDKVAHVYPLISGNVQDVSVQLGDYVHAGQVLGVIKSAEVAGYSAGLATAESNVALNASLLARAKDMSKSGLASQVDVTTAQVAYDQAVAAKTAAERVLSINGNDRKGEYIIKSPVSGFIVEKNINNGMAIRPDNSNNLFTISDLNEIWIQANVYEANIPDVHPGDEVDVTTIPYPDKVFKGKIDKLMNVLDQTNRVMKMRVVLPNPGYLLKPQMFATVTVNNTLNQQATSISSKSLVFDHSQYYVIVFKTQKDVELRSVDVISVNGDKAFIRDGVKPGELLVGSQAILIYGALNN